MKKITLDCSRLKERGLMRDYMTELFGFDEECGFLGNLDHLNDLLSEVTCDVEICISKDILLNAAESSFSWKTLRALILSSKDNPHITISTL